MGRPPSPATALSIEPTSIPVKPSRVSVPTMPGPITTIATSGFAEKLPSAEMVAHGKEIWQQAKCWECHGKQGKGDDDEKRHWQVRAALRDVCRANS